VVTSSFFWVPFSFVLFIVQNRPNVELCPTVGEELVGDDLEVWEAQEEEEEARNQGNSSLPYLILILIVNFR